jgi:toxin ParE1/3/4
MQILISERASTDLLKITTYRAERNVAAAEALVSELDKKFDSLAHFPFIGRERSSLAPGLRSNVAGVYVIFYVVDRDRLTSCEYSTAVAI